LHHIFTILICYFIIILFLINHLIFLIKFNYVHTYINDLFFICFLKTKYKFLFYNFKVNSN